MTPGQGPDQTLPDGPNRPQLTFTGITVAIGVAVLLCSLVYAAIEDGPDGFPTGIKGKPQPPKVVPWVGVIRPTEPVPEPEEPADEEVILDLTPVEEIVGLTCQDSVEDCVAAKTKECGKHPPQPGATAVHLAKVTRFELGKTCQFICSDGVERSCIVLRGKPKPKPEDTALTP